MDDIKTARTRLCRVMWEVIHISDLSLKPRHFKLGLCDFKNISLCLQQGKKTEVNNLSRADGNFFFLLLFSVFKFILSGYSCFTMLYSFLLYSKVNWLHMRELTVT